MNVRSVAGKLGAAAVFAAVCAVSSGQDASAASAQRTFQVSATITTVCLITAANLDFGTYTGAQLDSSANITINCTNGTSPNVIANLGQNALGAQRRMRLNASFANYNLYQNAARTIAFPTTTPGVAAASTGTTTVTVYGRVPSGQNPANGAYTDSVNFTLTF